MAKAKYGSNDQFSAVGGLSVIGAHCYAYSGLYAANTTPVSALNFQTGAFYVVGSVQLNAAVDDDNASLTNICSLNIKFNGISVGLISSGSDDTDVNTKSAPKSVLMNIVIPPLTTVEVSIDSTGDQADRYLSGVITGRVYA